MKKLIFTASMCASLLSSAQNLQLDFVNTFGGTLTDYAVASKENALGEVISVGTFKNTIDADPSTSVQTMVSNGGDDILISKFDSNGSLIWAKQIGGSTQETVSSLNFNSTNEIFITGSYTNTVDFDPGTGVQNQTSNGSIDCFVLKLDANGNFLWVKTFGGSGVDYPYGTVVDNQGNIINIGTFSNTVDFNPGPGVVNKTSNGGLDFFIQKMNLNGDVQWVTTAGGTGEDYLYDIAIDNGNSSNIFVAGSFENSLTVTPGVIHTSNGSKDNLYFALSGTNGLPFWSKSCGGTGGDEIYDIEVNGTTLFMGGRYNNTVDFDPGSGGTNVSLTASNNADAFILMTGTTGSFGWVKGIGGFGADYISAIHVDPTNELYIAGRYTALNCDFDPGTNVINPTTQNGNSDIFIEKLDANGDFVYVETINGTYVDHVRDIRKDSNGKILVSGYFGGTADFDFSSNTNNQASSGTNEFDGFFARYTENLIPPCIINIPDANFKSLLVNNPQINTNGDSEIQCSEATAFNGFMDIYGSITDLTGLEEFVNITELSCDDLGLTSLDVTPFTALTGLYCDGNQLTTLDISNNTNLQYLYVYNNNLTNLDFTGQTNLLEISCYGNQLTSLDVSANMQLQVLRCENNQLTSLIIPSSNTMTELACYSNMLTVLDISYQTMLTQVNCGNNLLNTLVLGTNPNLADIIANNNQLTSLNLTNLPALASINAHDNLLTTLDISVNSNIYFLNLGNNDLQSLNVANGNNTNITLFNTQGNPDLTCVEVDDAAYSTANWTNIDTQTQFSINCAAGITQSEEIIVEIFPNPTNGLVTIKSDDAIQSIAVHNADGNRILITQDSSIDLSKYSNGIYFVTVQTDNSTIKTRLIKQ